MASSVHPLYTQAMTLGGQNQWSEALPLFEQALTIDPNHPETLEGMGMALGNLGRHDEALACFKKAQALNPSSPSVAAHLGAVLQCLGRWEQAIDVLVEQLTKHPNDAKIHFNLAHAYQHLEKLDLAETHYQQALTHAPHYRSALTNLTVIYRERGRIDEAIQGLEQALLMEPGHGNSHYNLAFLLLQKGQFLRGWAEHEWRFRANITPAKHYPQPLWRGEEMAGQTLLVWWEQGFGDVIQCVRFIKLVAQKGIRVVLEVQPPLYTLLKDLDHTALVIATGMHPLPDFDRHVALMSLPHILGIDLDTLPPDVPYIPVPPSPPMPATGKPRIGIMWQGSPAHRNDQKRSMPMEQAQLLTQMRQFEWISLQVDGAPHPATLSPPEEINDFRDTAALMMTLDLVISVDSAVTHLAGALGVPALTLLSFAPDWRWLMGREDSPWYPKTRLFRQAVPGDWGSVIEAVKNHLNARFAP